MSWTKERECLTIPGAPCKLTTQIALKNKHDISTSGIPQTEQSSHRNPHWWPPPKRNPRHLTSLHPPWSFPNRSSFIPRPLSIQQKPRRRTASTSSISPPPPKKDQINTITTPAKTSHPDSLPIHPHPPTKRKEDKTVHHRTPPPLKRANVSKPPPSQSKKKPPSAPYSTSCGKMILRQCRVDIIIGKRTNRVNGKKRKGIYRKRKGGSTIPPQGGKIFDYVVFILFPIPPAVSLLEYTYIQIRHATKSPSIQPHARHSHLFNEPYWN